eukprot:10931761-Ditylum_brightwellii.AAC.1
MDNMPKGLKIINRAGIILFDSVLIAGVDYDENLFDDDDYTSDEDGENKTSDSDDSESDDSTDIDEMDEN